MNQSEKAAGESAWRIAAGFWLQSRELIKVHIPTKVSFNFIPFFLLMNGSAYIKNLNGNFHRFE
jgi:hypothetical protein